MSSQNWRSPGGNKTGGLSPNQMDLARAIVEMEQKLERTLALRLDVLQHQLTHLDRKLYFIETKLDAVMSQLGVGTTEMPAGQYGRGGRTGGRGRAGGGGGLAGSRSRGSQSNNLEMLGQYGQMDGGPIEEMVDGGGTSDELGPPALRFLFSQFSPKDDDSAMGGSRSNRSNSATTYYGGGSNRGGGGQQRKYSAHFGSQQMSIGHPNGRLANRGGGAKRNDIERKQARNQSGGNGGMDGGFGSVMRGSHLPTTKSRWSAILLLNAMGVANQNGQENEANSSNNSGTASKQTLGIGGRPNNREWTIRSQMGSYTDSDDTDDNEDGKNGDGDGGAEGGGGGEGMEGKEANGEEKTNKDEKLGKAEEEEAKEEEEGDIWMNKRGTALRGRRNSI